MTALDWGIVAFTLALGVWGYRQGLIVGFLTLLGFALGAFVGSRLAPCASAGARLTYAPLLAALGALIGRGAGRGRRWRASLSDCARR